MHRAALGRIVPADIIPDLLLYNIRRQNGVSGGEHFRRYRRFKTLVEAQFAFGRAACAGLYRGLGGMGCLEVNDEYIGAGVKIFTSDIEVEKYLYGKE